MQIDVSHNEPAGLQFEVSGDIEAGAILLTLRTDSDHGIMGSLAFLTPDGPQVIPFHQSEGGFTVHEVEGLD